MPYSLVAELIELQQLAEYTSRMGIHYVRLRTPEYFSRIGFFVSPHAWGLYYSPRKLNFSIEWTTDMSRDRWEEEECDSCMMELKRKTALNACNISEACWERVSQEKMSFYSLTHQVIYLMLGINSGCGFQMESMMKEKDPTASLNHMLQTLCSRVAVEAQTIADAGFPAELRDLFMEHIGICGTAGFLELANPQWLDIIQSWQAESGCYYKFDNERFNPENFKPGTYGKSRRKRAEELLSSGDQPCLAHRTSVALAALNTYMTLLIESKYGQEKLI
ncbi:hypothetical protein EG68_05474 [Paragonimus skrjabini miyazakii]|uniref:Uncharacterized protein n=1 Tax=Paragonimus skrjabini miyazakii TaxID=59628 RepID=A0A8S9Z3F2_9TREM|nr:hypothetical protein EG68_05474 [Paragonimus skrjabini miyazakii]